MTKLRIITIMVAVVLILLCISFIIPFIKHESMSNVTFYWIWGLSLISYWSSGGWNGVIIFDFPFILLSIGIIVEVVLLLKSYFNYRKDRTEAEVLSRECLKRGIYIIIIELFWTLWLCGLMTFWPYGIYYIEVPFFFRC